MRTHVEKTDFSSKRV